MGGDYHQLSRYDAIMCNRVAGKCARGGNYNAPTVIGEFLQDIPYSFKIARVSGSMFILYCYLIVIYTLNDKYSLNMVPGSNF